LGSSPYIEEQSKEEDHFIKEDIQYITVHTPVVNEIPIIESVVAKQTSVIKRDFKEESEGPARKRGISTK
jgi:hypothetical protein